MKRSIFPICILYISILLPACENSSEPIDWSDAARFRGDWELVRLDTSTYHDTPVILIFKDSSFTLIPGDMPCDGEYVFNPRTDPKRLDIETNCSGRWEGIYRFITDDSLQVKVPDDGYPRPVHFGIEQHYNLLSLKRRSDIGNGASLTTRSS